MVYNGEIDAKTKALVKFLKEDSFLTVKEITKRFKVSRATVYRCLKASEIIVKEKRKPSGRPRKISSGDERVIRRNIGKLRKIEGNFSCHRLRAKCGLHHVSLITFNRALKRMGYKFCEARRKGILSSADRAKRVKFAREVQTTFEDDFWKHKVCFYLDGVSF